MIEYKSKPKSCYRVPELITSHTVCDARAVAAVAPHAITQVLHFKRSAFL